MKRTVRFRAVLQDKLSDYITAIAWGSDKQIFAISAAGELVQWQLDSTDWQRTDFWNDVPESNSSLPPPALNALGLSANGQYLAIGGQAGRLIIWDISQNQPTILRDQTFQNTWLDQLAWHPSKSILAAGVGRHVYLWEVSQTEPIQILEFASSTVLNLAWHPNGQYLAVGGHGGVKIWDINANTLPEKLEVPGASLCTAWSPDGKFLASGNLDRTLSVMDYGHPPPWLMQGFPSKVSTVAWRQSSSQAALLAATASDGISIWSQQDDLSWQSTVLTGHQGLIRAITFQPNSNLLASAGNDSHIKLWNVGNTTQHSITGAPTGTHCLSWNQSGNRLAIGGTDGAILIYESDYAGKGFSQEVLTNH